jgi:hypothetical protein
MKKNIAPALAPAATIDHAELDAVVGGIAPALVAGALLVGGALMDNDLRDDAMSFVRGVIEGIEGAW